MKDKLSADVIEALDWAFESNVVHDAISQKQRQIDHIGMLRNLGTSYDDARERQDDAGAEKIELERRFETLQIAVGSLIGRQVEGSDALFAPES
jgi:hypothetical protein